MERKSVYSCFPEHSVRGWSEILMSSESEWNFSFLSVSLKGRSTVSVDEPTQPDVLDWFLLLNVTLVSSATSLKTFLQ